MTEYLNCEFCKDLEFYSSYVSDRFELLKISNNFDILSRNQLISSIYSVTIDGSLQSTNYRVILYDNYIVLHGLNEFFAIPALQLNIEFSRLQFIRDQCNNKIGFILCRQQHHYQFFCEEPDRKKILKAWISLLNNYVIRTGSIQKYIVLDQIGQGGQAKVLKVYQKSNKKYDQKPPSKVFALKMILKEKLTNKVIQQNLINEIRTQRHLKDCKNVTRLFKIYDNSKYVSMLLEYQDYGNLGELIREKQSFSEDEVRLVGAQLLLAVDFMGRKNILHRDLKPENILLHSRELEIRIADFGLSCYRTDDGSSPSKLEICGTPGYIAPEILKKQVYSEKSDIFSIGVILYNLLTRKDLFKALNKEGVLQKNQECDLTRITAHLELISKESTNLIFQLLEDDPNKRISAIEAMNHPWFQALEAPIKQAISLNRKVSELSILSCSKIKGQHTFQFNLSRQSQNKAEDGIQILRKNRPQNLNIKITSQAYIPEIVGQTPGTPFVHAPTSLTPQKNNYPNVAEDSVVLNYHQIINQYKELRGGIIQQTKQQKAQLYNSNILNSQFKENFVFRSKPDYFNDYKQLKNSKELLLSMSLSEQNVDITPLRNQQQEESKHMNDHHPIEGILVCSQLKGSYNNSADEDNLSDTIPEEQEIGTYNQEQNTHFSFYDSLKFLQELNRPHKRRQILTDQ